jgi:PAS domain S-box-containing protein
MGLSLHDQNQLLTFFDVSPDVIIFKDGEGRWIKANETALRVFGVRDSIYQGKKSTELVPTNNIDKSLLIYEDTDSQAWSIGSAIRVEQSILDSNGEILVFDILKVPSYHEDGRRKGLLVVGRNISEQKNIQNQLVVGYKILEQSLEGVIICNQDNEVIYVNPAFTKTTGYELKEVKRKNPRFLQSGIHNKQFYAELWDELKINGSWEGEIWNQRKTGEIYLEWLSIRSIRDQSGEITNYIATFRDITEQEQVRRDVILTGQLQQNLLPCDLVDKRLSIRTIYVPAKYVSGDFYDYKWNKDETILFGYLFDVMGHGIATALQSTSLRVLFEQVIDSNHFSLHEKLEWVNQQAYQLFSEDTFAAAICFSIDFNQQILTYSSAGITNFFVQRKNQVEKLMVYGSFLGLLKEQNYITQQLRFQSGDSFHFMSDGLLDLLPPFNNISFNQLFHQLQAISFQSNRKDDISAMCFYIY